MLGVILTIEYKIISNKIKTWLKYRGYDIHQSFIVDDLFLFINRKISGDDLKEFDEKFGFELTLKKVSFNSLGEKSDFVYSCFPHEVGEYKSKISDWLKKHQISAYSTCKSECVLLSSYDELSDELISDFERDFDVICRGYEISCGSSRVKYEFYFNDNLY